MTQRKRREQESLIPTIKGEEKRLEERLRDTRDEAARIVADARGRAEAALARTAAELPLEIARERDARVAVLAAKGAEILSAAAEQTRVLEREADGRMPRAVAYIVSRVRPGGRQ